MAWNGSRSVAGGATVISVMSFPTARHQPVVGIASTPPHSSSLRASRPRPARRASNSYTACLTSSLAGLNPAAWWGPEGAYHDQPQTADGPPFADLPGGACVRARDARHGESR